MDLSYQGSHYAFQRLPCLRVLVSFAFMQGVEVTKAVLAVLCKLLKCHYLWCGAKVDSQIHLGIKLWSVDQQVVPAHSCFSPFLKS